MEFVSCFKVSDASVENTTDEVVLCRTRFTKEQLPGSADDLAEMMIEGLVVSEGTEIHTRCDCRPEDLHVFASDGLQQYVWYELLRQLSGHKMRMPSMGGHIQFTKWVCYAPEKGKWSLVMESESSGIIQKVAQLDLYPVESGELNLFQMANELFLECCECNDEIGLRQEQVDKLQAHLKELQDERVLLDELLERRDAKTRSIVVGLLNEKKKKIAELQQLLGDQCPLDSQIINRYVKEPVSGHISPGKRINNPGWPKKELKRRPTIKKEESNQIFDDFDDFKFLGIQKQDPADHEAAEGASNTGTSSTDQSTGQETDLDEDG